MPHISGEVRLLDLLIGRFPQLLAHEEARRSRVFILTGKQGSGRSVSLLELVQDVFDLSDEIPVPVGLRTDLDREIEARLGVDPAHLPADGFGKSDSNHHAVIE